MIQECDKCKRSFLTESDIYMVIPTIKGVKLQCDVCITSKVENLKLLVKAAYPYMEYVFMNLSPKLENTELFLKHKRWLENADEVLK
jgi:hypothetical protein